MSITVLDTNDKQVNGSSSSCSIDCTGADMLVVAVGLQNGPNATTITALTYDSVALTLAVKEGNTAESRENSEFSAIYYLPNPSSGTNTLSITWSSGANHYIYGWALSGVNTTGQPDATGGGEVASGRSISANLSTVADNSVIFGACQAQASVTAGTNQTESSYTEISYVGYYAGTSGAISPAGAKSVTVNIGSSTKGTFATASFAPTAVGGASNNSIFFGGGM